MPELSRDSTYFLGIDEITVRKIQAEKPDVYSLFFSPPYLDVFSVGKRKIVWFKEPDIPSLRLLHPEEEKYLHAVVGELQGSGVPEGAARVYRQTVTLEELE